MTLLGSQSAQIKPEQEKRVLVFAGDFSTTEDDRWLIDDIVDEFVAQGALVDVLAFDNKRPRPRGVTRRNNGRVRIISVGPEKALTGRLAKVLSRLQSALLMHAQVLTTLRGRTYDLAVFTSVAVLSAGLPRLLRARGRVKHLTFVLWDFFPVHQIEVNRLPSNAVVRFLKHLELFNFAKADTVAVMSPANEAFLRKYHPRFEGRTIILPPWARTDSPVAAATPKAPAFTAIFGGQLVEGRGVETIVQAAALLHQKGSDLKIVIAGDGSLRERMEELAASLKLQNIDFLGSIPRPEYRSLLATAHVGIAATVTGVSVPAFPSKIVEYCRASVPVVACLDPASDAGELLQEFGAGILLEANDAEGLARVLVELESSYRNGTLVPMAKAARRLFESRLSSARAAEAILSDSEAGAATRTAGAK